MQLPGGPPLPDGIDPEVEASRVGSEFRECMTFLLRVLTSKLRVGHHPHLGDLVMRINFNCYYMDEDAGVLGGGMAMMQPGRMSISPGRRGSGFGV